MGIASAIERGSQVFVYDERGQMLFSKRPDAGGGAAGGCRTPLPKGSGPHDGLLGFTGSTVTVRSGSVVFIYGLHGEIVYSKPA
jgi:hypothetical protein